MTLLRTSAVVAAFVMIVGGCAATPATDDSSSPTLSIDASGPLEPQAKAAIVADDVATLEALVAAGLDLESDLGAGFSPLHIAANAGSDDVVRYLIATGSEIDARANQGETALMFASAHAPISTVTLLLDAGADSSLVDTDTGMAPLHYATGSANYDVMSLLLGAGVDINQLMANAETPVLIATHKNDLTGITLLVEAGADLSVRQTDTGVSAVGVARIHNEPEILEYLLAHGGV